MLNEEKQSDSTEQKGEELSCALLKLYRLAYESLINKSNCDINKEYETIAKEYTEVFKSVKPPTTTEQLIAIIEICKSNGKNDYIYDIKNIKEEEKEAKIALVEYCVSDNIDAAILYLLNYKLKNGSCTDIVNYVHSESAGWSSYSYAAIHKAISHINRSAYSYKNKDEISKQFDIEKIDWNLDDKEKNKIKERNKPKEEKRDKYISNIIDSKYGKTVFLIEILLRENCSTTLKSDASGWRVAAKNETVFNAALSCNNIDVLRSIFQYGIDIDIETTCTSGGSSMRTDSSSSWKPIHTAIEKNNYQLTSLIIKRGANINSYRTHIMSNEYGSRQNEQKTALYMICSKSKDNNKMLKLILSEHQQKYNGIADVNKFNCYVTNENKPKDVYGKQKKEAKRLRKQQAAMYDRENNKDESNNETEINIENISSDENEWDDPRSGYYVNPYVNMNNYETTMHIAIAKGDIEQIKLLLIYGGDISLCNIKTPNGHGGYGWNSRMSKSVDRSIVMRNWYDKFMNEYKKTNKLQTYERVQNVYEILKESQVNDNIKKQIEKIFKTKSIWFPEMLDFYPNNMGQALSIIIESLSNIIPIVIINIVIEYFYNIVEQEVKEANQLVDINNKKTKPNVSTEK